MGCMEKKITWKKKKKYVNLYCKFGFRSAPSFYRCEFGFHSSLKCSKSSHQINIHCLLLVSAHSLAFARQLHKQNKWAISFQKQSSPPQPTGFNSFIYSIWRCPWGTFQNHLLLSPLFAWWAALREGQTLTVRKPRLPTEAK